MRDVRLPQRRWMFVLTLSAVALLLLGLGLALRLYRFSPIDQGLPQAPAGARATAEGRALAEAQTTALQEDFADPRRSLFKETSGGAIAFAFVDEAYRIEVKQAEIMAWSLGETRYADGAVQVEAVLAQGPGTTASGLIFRYRDDRNFYLFSVAGNGFYNLELCSDGVWKTLIEWTPTPALQRPGKPNTLRVETMGDRIALYVNEVWLEETRDQTLTSGRAGMAVHTYAEGGATVLFDNFAVTAGARSAGSVFRQRGLRGAAGHRC